MSEKERADMLNMMRNNFDLQDEAKLGIFWYDKKNDKLLGVTKIEAMDVPFSSERSERKTIRSLHKSWWKKQEMKYRQGLEANAIFAQDYTKIPRGRLFQRRDGTFELMCGSWINQRIVDLVVDEFDLQGQKLEVVIDPHWELGHGWSEELMD